MSEQLLKEAKRLRTGLINFKLKHGPRLTTMEVVKLEDAIRMFSSFVDQYKTQQ